VIAVHPVGVILCGPGVGVSAAGRKFVDRIGKGQSIAVRGEGAGRPRRIIDEIARRDVETEADFVGPVGAGTKPPGGREKLGGTSIVECGDRTKTSESDIAEEKAVEVRAVQVVAIPRPCRRNRIVIIDFVVHAGAVVVAGLVGAIVELKPEGVNAVAEARVIGCCRRLGEKLHNGRVRSENRSTGAARIPFQSE
jgi:hypothetical protein